MAGIRAIAQTAKVVTGTSAKTVLQLVAPANQRLLVKEWSLSFDGTSNSATPILVRVLRQTDAGTMSALSPVKDNSSDAETLQSSAQHTATVEPSAGNVLASEQVHPQGGYTWQAPFGGDIVVPGGTRLGIEVTAGASVDVVARMVYEE